MNDDPSEVDVLYIKAHCDSSCLQNLTDEIVDVFVKQGIDEYIRVASQKVYKNSHCFYQV